METVQKRGPCQWRVQIRKKGHPPQTRTFDVRSESDAWVRQVEGEMDRGLFVSWKEAMLLLIANNGLLGPEWCDHSLEGDWVGHRECHVGGIFARLQARSYGEGGNGCLRPCWYPF